MRGRRPRTRRDLGRGTGRDDAATSVSWRRMSGCGWARGSRSRCMVSPGRPTSDWASIVQFPFGSGVEGTVVVKFGVCHVSWDLFIFVPMKLGTVQAGVGVAWASPSRYEGGRGRRGRPGRGRGPGVGRRARRRRPGRRRRRCGRRGRARGGLRFGRSDFPGHGAAGAHMQRDHVVAGRRIRVGGVLERGPQGVAEVPYPATGGAR